MAAPEYVPVRPIDDVRAYESPPRRPDPWRADRPGDLVAGQPRGDGMGDPAPDGGYALKLANEVFRSQLALGGVAADDAVAGGVAVALKRASIFGRAPVVHDLRLAFTVWGFLDDAPDDALVRVRERVFAGIAHAHHYGERRRVVDAVPEATLRKTPSAVAEELAVDWRELIHIEEGATHG